jgi:hypothetical protein
MIFWRKIVIFHTWVKSKTMKLEFATFELSTRKRIDWLYRNRDNVCEWGYMSTHGLLFQ